MCVKGNAIECKRNEGMVGMGLNDGSKETELLNRFTMHLFGLDCFIICNQLFIQLTDQGLANRGCSLSRETLVFLYPSFVSKQHT